MPSDTTTVTIQAAGATVATVVREGEPVLVGRSPSDPPPAPDAGLVAPRALRLAADHVSRHQLLVSSDGASVRVRDLGGRGRTWALVPPRGALRVERPCEVVLRVEPAAGASAGVPPIDDADWRDPANFGLAVERTLRAWFEGLGVAAELERTPVEQAPRGAEAFPLEDGSRLTVRAVEGQTLLVPWSLLQDRVRAWIHEQNVRYCDESPAQHPHLHLVSPAFRQAHARAVDAARRGLPVVLVGGRGVGKRELALCAWSHSPRRLNEFEEVACGALRPDEAHAALFGAGPSSARPEAIPGAVERADGGVLHLDDVDALDAATQYALLRFLETRRFDRVGGGRPRFSDVHVVCTTALDLRAAVARGAFREDLWYRLAGRVIEVPALRERPEEVEAVLQAHKVDARRSLRDALDVEARRAVRDHDWPGGFRELAGFLARLPAPREGAFLDADTCRRAIAEGAVRPPPRPAEAPARAGPPSFPEVALRAARAYAAEHGDPGASGARWAESIRDYVERYLKPLHLAGVLGLESLRAKEDPAESYQELASRVGVADGGTVKKFLAHYVESFRRP